MKKSLIRNLLERRVPQILGSYFVGSTTLILFVDWLVKEYGFSEHFSSIALFGLISILPSVIILAYFHGAPGKDEWTRVEKFGIPINILFIAAALFTGYKYNVWQESPPDHSKVHNSFMVHISSNQKNIDQFKLTEFWLESVGGMKYIVGGATEYIDSIYPANNNELDKIRRYVNVNLNKEFMNYKNITINYPDNQKELNMMDTLISTLYITYLDEDVNDEELQKKKDEELKAEVNQYNKNLDYFNIKYDTYVDKMYNIKIYKALLSSKGKKIRYIAELEKPNKNTEIYIYTITIPVINQNNKSKVIGMNFTYGYADKETLEEEGGSIEKYFYEAILELIKDASFGTKIGEIDNILDSNLVTIRLNNLELIKGTDLIFLERSYPVEKKSERSKSLKRYIEDNLMIYNYLYKHPDQIENLEDLRTHSSNDHWLKREKRRIDSLENNFYTILDSEDITWGLHHNQFRYYLRIINIQDSIATAKITGSVFPFARPKIGDKINIK